MNKTIPGQYVVELELKIGLLCIVFSECPENIEIDVTDEESLCITESIWVCKVESCLLTDML